MHAHLAWLAALCGPDATGPALLFGLLAAGAAGGVSHCTLMCGPFVLGQVSDRLACIPLEKMRESTRLGSALLLGYHAGRLTTYAVLGALAAALGTAGAAALMPRALPGLLLAGAAGLFLCHALARLAPGLKGLGVLGRAPAGWTRAVRRFAAAAALQPGGGFLLGVALGFLPCGLLYAAIAVAAAAGGAGQGALAMLAFGLGTVPGLVAVGVAGHAAGRAWHRMASLAAPLIMLANAALLAAMAWQRLATPG